MKTLTLLKNFLLLLILGLFLSSCGTVDKLKNVRKPVDLTKEPLDPDERARRNIREGRGISLGNIAGGGKTTYEFSTSNPMWRATLETIDFIPLTTVDYSGGLIISDWYNDNASTNESIKISVRFLSNEVRSDSIKIQVFEKKCSNQNNCTTKLVNSSISNELTRAILNKAAILEKSKDTKK